ncbi:bacteriocin biosynthesis protein SagD, partial [Kitasatospora sp. NPDC059571]
MTADTAVPETLPDAPAAAPWEAVCRALERLVASAPDPSAPGTGPAPLAVRPLGVRDELTCSAEPFTAADGAARPVPVHLHGHQAVVGPFPGPAGTAGRGPSPRCLARRWHALRPPADRDAQELGARPRAAGAPPIATPPA